jgi:hypothetical protein
MSELQREFSQADVGIFRRLFYEPATSKRCVDMCGIMLRIIFESDFSKVYGKFFETCQAGVNIPSAGAIVSEKIQLSDGSKSEFL